MAAVPRLIGATAGRVASRAARRYVPGPLLADALAVREGAERRGFASTLGYWDSRSDDAAAVERQFTAAVAALESQSDAEVSLKVPALGLDATRVGRIVAAAGAARVRVHCDSLQPPTQDATIELAADCRPSPGITLPSRWRRSAEDAERAIAAGLRVRVVKGQFTDGSPKASLGRAPFLDLVDRLAGRAALVAVATHDPELAALAARRLRTAGTTFELQVLYGLPAAGVEAVARELDAPLRLYVPYGSAYLPYALRSAWRSPRTVVRLGRDLLGPQAAPIGSP
jgi:proline dehydrogenase